MKLQEDRTRRVDRWGGHKQGQSNITTDREHFQAVPLGWGGLMTIVTIVVFFPLARVAAAEVNRATGKAKS